MTYVLLLSIDHVVNYEYGHTFYKQERSGRGGGVADISYLTQVDFLLQTAHTVTLRKEPEIA